jgi:hypothetical protein
LFKWKWKRKEGRHEERKEGWKDGKMEGRMEGWKDGRKDGPFLEKCYKQMVHT